METPVKQGETLTHSAFLLAFDLRKERLANRSELGYLLRAAAMAELLLEGSLTDESGKARALAKPAGAGAGSLRAVVWEQISGSPPRTWRRWIRKDCAKAVRVVRDELAADRLIRVERHRVLFIPVERIVPRKAYLSRRLAERVGRAIRGGQPVGRMERDVRVLAALAVAADMKGVLGRGEARRYRNRIGQLSVPVEPIATALRKAVEATRQSGADGGG
ncbi:GPP34 family phosphoprotein [Nonomuraea sp. GTA35]|uniref:GOLPH3/VPS74 family protein n=1 Tax=Nonomuraea sp. GTA35 TaxID=1676746 RepID=UPI0035C19CC2